MKNKNIFDEALTRCVNDTMAKDTLTQHDIDNLLKAATISANMTRNETDIYKADKEAEANKYAADKKAQADIERAKADKEAAKIKAEADERAYRHQFWGNVIVGGLRLAEGAISVAAVILMFKAGLSFEQTGVITSNTMKNILSNGLKIVKR